MQRLALLFAAACALTVPVQAVAQSADAEAATTPSPQKLQVAREIITLGYPEAEREALFFGAMDQMVIQMREATLPALPTDEPEIIALLDEWVADFTGDSKVLLASHIPNLMENMAVAYANIFTQEELDDVLAFVSTPSGQRFFLLSPAVISEPNFAAANQAYMNEVMANLEVAKTDFQKKLFDYLASRVPAEPIDES